MSDAAAHVAGAAAAELPPALRDATADQPAARLALAGALAAGPTHAYLFAGPPGTGKRAAARAFGAEILATGAADPDDARRRAALDPSPHPDLVWLIPPGTQHLVEDVRDRVIKGAAYRPFEGERRVFVIEAAEAMADESQNALLKTLEEPPSFVHLILLTAEPAALLETVTSRCQEVRFTPLSAEAIEQRLGVIDAGSPTERAAAASLSGGDADRAAFLLSAPGRDLRAKAESSARAMRDGRAAERPWLALLEAAEQAGETAGAEASARVREAQEARPKALRRRREAEEVGRRAARARRTELLDFALGICGAWFRDLAAVGEGAPDLVLNRDRAGELRADAEGLDPAAARAAAALVLETRRNLQVNIAEELALEALFYRAEAILRRAA
jgi:DNA polymerase III subunit delta'